jgi:hypothetical protein
MTFIEMPKPFASNNEKDIFSYCFFLFPIDLGAIVLFKNGRQ